MDHDGPGILRVAILDFLEELQHANRGEGHPEVWPAGEVELGDQPGSSGTVAALLRGTDTQRLYLCLSHDPGADTHQLIE